MLSAVGRVATIPESRFIIWRSRNQTDQRSIDEYLARHGLSGRLGATLWCPAAAGDGRRSAPRNGTSIVGFSSYPLPLANGKLGGSCAWASPFAAKGAGRLSCCQKHPIKRYSSANWESTSSGPASASSALPILTRQCWTTGSRILHELLGRLAESRRQLRHVGPGQRYAHAVDCGWRMCRFALVALRL